MIRCAPKDGYTSDVKAAYREQVWDAFGDGIADIVTDEAGMLKVVIMPSSEGLEIETALARGLREDQIVCVDRSAAVIATSQWRKKYPNVNFFAAEIGEVGHKIKHRKWVVRVANLDLCGNFSDATIDAVAGFMKHTPVGERLSLAVTISKGREGSALTRLLKATDYTGVPVKDDRLRVLFNLTNALSRFDVKTMDERVYTASKTPMVWCALECVDVKVRYRFEADRLNHAKREGVKPFFDCFDVGDSGPLTDEVLMNRAAFVNADKALLQLAYVFGRRAGQMVQDAVYSRWGALDIKTKWFDAGLYHSSTSQDQQRRGVVKYLNDSMEGHVAVKYPPLTERYDAAEKGWFDFKTASAVDELISSHQFKNKHHGVGKHEEILALVRDGLQ